MPQSVDVKDLMPQLEAELAGLVAIPSVSVPGQIDQPLLDAFEMTSELFAGAGVQVSKLELPNTAPVITGEIPAPPGAPTVLLYSHYDVVGAGDESNWTSAPFELRRDGDALYGRGAADTKSNILMHVGALRAWNGKPPVGIKLCIEGYEEIGSGELLGRVADHAELFDADTLVIGDMGSIIPGQPTLSTALRGMANVEVVCETLDSPVHSGLFGGAAPDALLALIHLIASMHDVSGDVAVDGLLREEWPDAEQSEEQFRKLGGVREGLPLLGSGGLGSRIWTGPAITPIGIDVADVANALNSVNANARALLNVRVHPEQDAVEAQNAVLSHIEAQRPFGIELSTTRGPTGNGFRAKTDGAAYAAARAAWAGAYGRDPVLAGGGGSIPIVSAMANASPEAEALLIGTTDGFANIHGPDERVLASEFAAATTALADFFGRYAAGFVGQI